MLICPRDDTQFVVGMQDDIDELSSLAQKGFS